MNSILLSTMFRMFSDSEAVSPIYPIVRIILLILIVLCALFMIFIVLIQPGNSSGLGAIGGGAETFLGKNKAKTIEGKLKRLTWIVAIAFAVFSIAFAIISIIPF